MQIYVRNQFIYSYLKQKWQIDFKQVLNCYSNFLVFASNWGIRGLQKQ